MDSVLFTDNETLVRSTGHIFDNGDRLLLKYAIVNSKIMKNAVKAFDKKG